MSEPTDTDHAHPHVTIVVLNWNGMGDTLECLDSLARVEYPSCSVIVVDNGSTDGSVEAIQAWSAGRRGGVLIRNERNLGFAGGSNVGIRRALEDGTDYILLLNNDTVVTPRFLAELVAVAERDGQIGIVGPKVYEYGNGRVLDSAGTRVIFWLAQPFLRGHGEVDYGQYDEEEDMPYITGCALLIKRDVIDRIGLLDEDYFYFDDTDWGYRARRAGYRLVYVPRSVIAHKGSRAIGLGSPLYYYHMTRSRVLFARKHVGLIPFVCGFLPYMALYRYGWTAVRLALRRRWDRLAALSRGLWSGLTVTRHHLRRPDERHPDRHLPLRPDDGDAHGG